MTTRRSGMPLGFKMTKREVPCSHGCGTILLRAVHFANAICPKCDLASKRKGQAGRGQRQREQARRYRILMALSPYDSWEELLAAVRIRQRHHNRNVSYDLAVERRRKTG